MNPDDARPPREADVRRLRARLALVRSLLDELERHLSADSRAPINLDWLCPVAAQLADEAAALSRVLAGTEPPSQPSVQ